MEVSKASHVVGGYALDQGRPQYHCGCVPGAGHREAEQGQQVDAGQPEADQADSPDRSGSQHCEALPIYSADWPGEHCAEDPADRDRGGHQAERLWGAAETLCVDCREQGDGHAEQRGARVGQERCEDHPGAGDEPQSLGYGPWSGPLPAPGRAHRGQPGDAVEGEPETDGVDQITDLQAQRSSDHSGEGGPDGHAPVQGEHLERRSGGELLAAQEHGHERPPNWAVHGVDPRLEAEQDVERPDPVQMSKRLGSQGPGQPGQDTGRYEHRLSPVQDVTDGATGHRRHHGRHGDSQPDQPDRQGAVGEDEHLEQDRVVRHLAADARQAVTDPEPPVGR